MRCSWTKENGASKGSSWDLYTRYAAAAVAAYDAGGVAHVKQYTAFDCQSTGMMLTTDHVEGWFSVYAAEVKRALVAQAVALLQDHVGS